MHLQLIIGEMHLQHQSLQHVGEEPYTCPGEGPALEYWFQYVYLLHDHHDHHHHHHLHPHHHHVHYHQHLEIALVRALLMAIWVSGDEKEESPESVIFRQRLQSYIKVVKILGQTLFSSFKGGSN